MGLALNFRHMYLILINRFITHQNILPTEEEKVEKYQDLALEIKRIHRAARVTVISLVIGAPGTISGNAKAWYRRLSLPDIFGSLQL